MGIRQRSAKASTSGFCSRKRARSVMELLSAATTTATASAVAIMVHGVFVARGKFAGRNRDRPLEYPEPARQPPRVQMTRPSASPPIIAVTLPMLNPMVLNGPRIQSRVRAPTDSLVLAVRNNIMNNTAPATASTKKFRSPSNCRF